MQTDHDIQHTTLQYLKSWREAMDPPSATNFLTESLLGNQLSNGWQRFFEGWILKEWTTAQQAYYSSIKSYRTGRRWTVAIIKKMWDIAWDLWEHWNCTLHETQNMVSSVTLYTN